MTSLILSGGVAGLLTSKTPLKSDASKAGGLHFQPSVIQCSWAFFQKSNVYLPILQTPNTAFKNKILVHVQFNRDRNTFIADSIDFKPRLVQGSKLEEVAKLSDIQGYWYAATTADISGMSAVSGTLIVERW